MCLTEQKNVPQEHATRTAQLFALMQKNHVAILLMECRRFRCPF